MSDLLNIVNGSLSLARVLELSLRLQGLAIDAQAAGKTSVTIEEMQAAVGENDAAMDALRAAIERAEGR